ncbi:nitroreductase family protein [Chloroflexota bacterium]
MEVLETIKNRRTIRNYKTTPLEEEILDSILAAGMAAPSWGNTQTWRWVVIKDQNIKKDIAENVVRAGNGGVNAVKRAPVVIAVCAELNKAGFRDGKPATDKGGYWYMFDAGLSLENMVLAAESHGLGSLFIGGMNSKKLRSLLGVPKEYICVILMVIGYPDEKPEARPRKEIDEIVFKDKFGAKRKCHRLYTGALLAMRSKAATVIQYLSKLPENRKETIRTVREVILKNLPEGYEEVMNWGDDYLTGSSVHIS